jgi:hypothetical protein
MKQIIKPGYLLTLALFTLASVPASAHHEGSEPGLALYDPFQVRVLNLSMDPTDWETIKADTTYTIEVHASLWEGVDLSATNMVSVSVRRKSGDRLGDKVSLKVDINEYYGLPGDPYPQAVPIWNGVKKLSLENGDDVNVVSEGFAWYLHHLATKTSDGYSDYRPGHAAWVKLMVNNQDMGVYLNVEQRDKTFLRNRGLYTQGETWLYKAGDKGSNYSLKVGNPDSPTLANVLCYSPFGAASSDGGGGGGGRGKKGGGSTSTTCEAPRDAAGVTAQLDQHIEMRGMLTQGAVEAFTMGPDAMFSKGKNFYFVDFAAGKRRYIPWDLDTVFTTQNPEGSIYGQERKKGKNTEFSQSEYQQLILNNPEFRRRYNCIMDGLVNGPMSTVAIDDFLTRLEPVLSAAGLESDPNNNIDGSLKGLFQSLRQWATDRAVNIQGQLANESFDCSSTL